MKMTRSKIVAVAVATLAFTLVAAPNAPQRERAKPTSPSDFSMFGGVLMRPAKGTVAYCDFQSRISKTDILGFFVSRAECPIQLNWEHRKMTSSFDLAKAAELKGNAAAAIFIVDDPALPMSLVAMEEKWGLVNLAKLVTDKPNIIKLLHRTEKLVTRVATGVLGGSHCLEIPFSAMKPVYSLADLDKMEAHAFSPAALTELSYTLPKLGLSRVTPCTYEDACVEGWAPAPTNDVQKEIWADVKNPANRFKKDLPELKK